MRLADWLKETGMAQDTFAAAIGVTQGRVSQLVRGGWPSADLALKIAIVTDGKVTANDFMLTEAS
jgi:predicted XRE-type DNA-binding protein